MSPLWLLLIIPASFVVGALVVAHFLGKVVAETIGIFFTGWK